MSTYDAIVIGAGGVGSATLAELAARGLRVLGIDRFAPPHDHGSSHGQTRVIRQAYFEHPDYVPLLRRTYELWGELQQRAGASLLTQCGLLEVGPPDGEVVGGVRRAAAMHDLAVHQLSAAEVADRWPALRVPDGLAAVFEQEAGYLQVERCIEAMLRNARELRAEVRTGCEVVRWQASGESVTVTTAHGVYSAGSLIVTAGAWAGSLLASLGVPLAPLVKTLYWYPVGDVPAATELPVYLYELAGGVPYGFPSLDGNTIKVAEHTGGTPIDDPLKKPSAIDEADHRHVESLVRQCLPQFGGKPLQHATCLYTMTPDHHFVVDRHPQHPNVVFAAGLSGHGYKFAPVLGEALADLVTAGSTKLPIDFLSLSRFQS